tara:strand:+ start:346 stop:1137 length:792 start_codon:yes stop_codon:yes gene_type:complete
MSKKIHLDKYYTPSDLAEYCVNKTNEIIGIENITQWIEPSAGNGSFLPFLKDNYIAYDLEPENENIIKQDYLSLNLPYLKGRCIIGNPPFGRSNNLIVSFYKKAITQCDYISFILPISQYENNIRLYDFDMIYSEKLKEVKYSGVTLKCCLNIYKKPLRDLNKKPNYKLKDVNIFEHHSKRNPLKFDSNTHDFRMCAWGAKMGTEVIEQKYALEYCIKVNNNKHKKDIVNLLKKADWKNNISTPNLCKWQIYKYLKDQIPELE